VNQQSGSELVRMLLLVAAVVAAVILVFFAVGYGLGRLLL
jgi:preprotein translocase subunit SecE